MINVCIDLNGFCEENICLLCLLLTLTYVIKNILNFLYSIIVFYFFNGYNVFNHIYQCIYLYCMYYKYIY